MPEGQTAVDVQEPLIPAAATPPVAATPPAAGGAPAASADAPADGPAKKGKSWDIGTIADAIYKSASVLGLAALLGFIIGFFLFKHWWKFLIAVVVIFVIIQGLAWFGIIHLHMSDVKNAAGRLVGEEGGVRAGLKSLGAKIMQNVSAPVVCASAL
eukprot:evm.model.scf_285EXC.7 EVM.evm.TU.scf_285EXC.7   scf_285EXC:47837-50234(+)